MFSLGVRKSARVGFLPTQSMTAEGDHSNTNKGRGRKPILPARTLMDLITWLLPPQKKEIDPNQFDLRHFRWIRMSDAWDGTSVSEQGFTTEVLLYGAEPVYSCQTARTTEPRKAKPVIGGQEEFIRIAEMGRVYLEIATIARRLGHQHAHEYTAPIDAVVSVRPQLYDALRRHRQFIGLKVWWVDHGYDLRLECIDAECMRVNLVPFPTKKRAPRSSRR
jgi:hypothetical protein